MEREKFKKVFEPAMFGPYRVKNRLYMAPTTTNMGTEEGSVTDKLVNWYDRIARGGVGTIIVEASSIENGYGDLGPGSIRITSDKHIRGLHMIAEVIKRQGVLAILQLAHGGRHAWGLDYVKSPSTRGYSTRVPSERIHKLATAEVKELEDKFADGVLRARQAAFDGVEFHAAHAYLISEFLSPYYNDREDEYGGSIENRMRFLLNIIRKSWDKAGKDFLIFPRLNVIDGIKGGLSFEEGKIYLKKLEELGVPLLDVSEGGYILEPDKVDLTGKQCKDGARFEYMNTKELKRMLRIPILVAGGVRNIKKADRLLAEEKADFIGLCRPLIADPDYPNKSLKGGNVRRCLFCDVCFNSYYHLWPVRCTVNPYAVADVRDEPGVFNVVNPVKKKVIIVGGGPGGMQAAITASQRGHEVIIFEKEEKLGVSLEMIGTTPYGMRYRDFRRFFQREISRYEVDVRLGVQADVGLIKKEKPDAVIVATGARPRMPDPADIPGADDPMVTNLVEILSGKATVENSAIIFGAGTFACDTALYLSRKGKKVHIITNKDYDGLLLEEKAVELNDIYHYIFILGRELRSVPNIKIITEAFLQEISREGVKVKDKEGKIVTYEVDKVIFAVGLEPNDSLYQELSKEMDIPIYLVGDANPHFAGSVGRAVHSGMKAAAYL